MNICLFPYFLIELEFAQEWEGRYKNPYHEENQTDEYITYKTKNKPKETKGDADINKTLKGVLINKNMKTPTDGDCVSFSEIEDTLLICDTPISTDAHQAFRENHSIQPLFQADP